MAETKIYTTSMNDVNRHTHTTSLSARLMREVCCMLCASKQAKHHAARHVSRRQCKPGNCVRVTHESVCRFDGDGMLHAVRIKAGKASYSNAFVQTSLYKQERKAGKPLNLKVEFHSTCLLLLICLASTTRMLGFLCARHCFSACPEKGMLQSDVPLW